MRRRPKGRKAAIVAAAAELFAERGFAAVGMDDIGAAVGVSGPAIYRHFRGKESLLGAVVLDAVSHVADAVEAAAAGRDPAAVDDVVRGAVAVALDRPAPSAVHLRERRRLVGDDDVAVRGVEQRIRRVWRQALRAARPELGKETVARRQAAVVGALTAATARPPGVARPRLDGLLVASSVAVMLAPVRPPADRRDRPAWRPPAGKRDEILTVALRLFAERGFHTVGIDEVGEAAGISGPTVYHYVGSKAELLVDAYDRAGQRVAAGVEQALQGAASAEDAAARLARSYAAIALDSVDLIAVTSGEDTALPEAERPRLARRRAGLRDAWVGVLRELRPDLAEPEIRLLVRMVFPLVNAAALAAPGRVELRDEVAGLALAHLGLGLLTSV